MEIERTARTAYGHPEKGGWVMATKKGKTKKQKARKGVIDFIEEATDPKKTVGIRFKEKLDKLSKDPEKLYEVLTKMGYGGLSKKNFFRMLNLYNTRGIVKKAAGETGY
jgi:hypothetical protein